MSLRGGCSPRRSNLLVMLGIASGEVHERPRNDVNRPRLDITHADPYNVARIPC